MMKREAMGGWPSNSNLHYVLAYSYVFACVDFSDDLRQKLIRWLAELRD